MRVAVGKKAQDMPLSAQGPLPQAALPAAGAVALLTGSLWTRRMSSLAMKLGLRLKSVKACTRSMEHAQPHPVPCLRKAGAPGRTWPVMGDTDECRSQARMLRRS